MSFGLTNALATFQARMHKVFSSYLRKFVLVFIYDILIYSVTLEDHVKYLRVMFEVLKENQLFAKKSKCNFGEAQIEYLGHIISDQGVSIDPTKIEAWINWPYPVNIKGFRGLLGLTGYYRRFIKNFVAISKPLTYLLKKGAFPWNDSATIAFEELKNAMVHAPVLALPDFTLPFVVEVDASGTGLGAVQEVLESYCEDVEAQDIIKQLSLDASAIPNITFKKRDH
ncbi:putative mitochondrial protein AtMg00860 [Nicotiana tabacum]|uniref:Mitochondrial protein AtMg00860 n=1 Tax=Nicotiana tabacum TaxID=4097 RepID=A0AC58SY76_TOBAC